MPFLNLDKDDWKWMGERTKWGVGLIGSVGLSAAFLPAGFLFFIPPAACGVLGYFAFSKKESSPKQRFLNAIAFAAVGLAAGIAFYFAV